MADAHHDKNLLIGLLAAQVYGVLPEQLTEAALAWTANPAFTYANYLAEKGFVRVEDAELLNQLAEQALAVHAGDMSALEKFFGDAVEPVRKALAGTYEAHDLDAIDTTPMEEADYSALPQLDISGVRETPGRYTLVSHHAKGGMGRVLIVHDEHLGRNIALKELIPTGGSGSSTGKPTPMRRSAALVARFLQEARITSQLEHPAIVPVYELGHRADGTLYYTMRLVRGRTLASALHGCKGLDERLRLLNNFISLCQAMAYAHSRNVIHRDIKPANVMIGQFGETVVLDWGLAKVRGTEDACLSDIQETLDALDDDDSLHPLETAYGRAMGTPHYMPPEQAEGKIEAIDERSDVYSLGSVLYEMLTGSPPYTGRSTREILDKVMGGRPAPVLKLAPQAPPAMAAICEKAMARTPNDRYATAAELAEEVLRFITGSLVQAYRYTPRQILLHYYKKHQLIINTTAAVVVFLIAVVAYSYWNVVRARNEEHIQRLAAEVAHQEEIKARRLAENKRYESNIRLTQAYIREGDLRRANEVLWNGPETLRSWEWSYLLNQANPDIHAIDLADSMVYSTTFSPDGSKLGSNTYPAPPVIYDARTGKQLVQCQAEPANYMTTIFSPDGKWYAGASREGVINVWDVLTGRLAYQFKSAFCAYCAAFHPSASKLYVGYNDQRIRVYDLEGEGSVSEFPPLKGSVYSLQFHPVEEKLLTECAGEGSLLQIWDLRNHAPVQEFSGSLPLFSPDGNYIAAIQHTDIFLWKVADATQAHRLSGHGAGIFKLAFDHSGNRMLSASADGSALLWDIAGERILQRFAPMASEAVVNAYFLNQDKQILVAVQNNHFFVYDTESGACLSHFRGQGQSVGHGALSADGMLFAATSLTHQIQMIHPLAPTGVEESYSLAAYQTFLQDPALSAASRASRFVLSVRPGVMLFDAAQKRALDLFTAPMRHSPRQVSLDDTGMRMAFLADRFVTPVMVDYRSGEPRLRSFGDAQTAISTLAIHPSGDFLATGDTAGKVTIWNSESGEIHQRFEDHEGTVTTIAFGGDGKILLSAGADGRVVCRRIPEGTLIRDALTQEAPVVTAAISTAGDRVFTIALNGAARLWNPETGKMLAEARFEAGVNERQHLWALFQARFLDGNNLILTHAPYDIPKLWHASSMTPIVSFSDQVCLAPMNNDTAIIQLEKDARLTMLDVPDGAARDRIIHKTPEEFHAYRQAWAVRTVMTEAVAPKIHVFLAAEDLSESLKRWAEIIENQENTPPLPAVGDPGAHPAFGFLCLQSGDLLDAVNGVRITDRESARGALIQAAALASPIDSPTLGLTLLRNNREVNCIYHTLPLTTDIQEISLSREEAQALLTGWIEQIAPAQMAAVRDSWIELSPLADSHLMRQAACPPNNAILIAFSDQPVTSGDILRPILQEVRRHISESNESVNFSVNLRCGLSQSFIRRYSVAGK